LHPLQIKLLGIPGWAIFLFLWALALFLFIRKVAEILKEISQGEKEVRWDNLGERICGVVVYVLGQKRLFKEPLAGTLHCIFFWGFIFLNLGVVFDFMEGLFPGIGVVKNTIFFSYWISLIDIVCLLVGVGVIISLIRRYIIRIPRLERNWEAFIILTLIFLIVATDICINGARIVLGEMPRPAFAPGAMIAAVLMDSPLFPKDLLQPALVGFWWLHLTVILCFLVYLPYSKHSHIFMAAFDIFFKKQTPLGQMTCIDIEKAEKFGALGLKDLSWKDLFDLYSCSFCGRCQDKCPAFNTDKPLSPKKIIDSLKKHLKAHKGTNVIEESISSDEIWSCTSCSACMETCPTFIEQMTKIQALKRGQVLMEGKNPPEASQMFKNLENNSNPWGIGSSTRGDWAKDLNLKNALAGEPFEYLYWVGCSGSFDKRNQKVVKAVVKLLQAAGVDFAILGESEGCCGDAARRTGNEYLFQMLAQTNIEIFKTAGVKKIICSCPHGFNTFKNEYPQLGGEYEVIHISELLVDLIKAGNLTFQPSGDQKITYHDSCFLGRYNEIYRSPREIIRLATQKAPLEMKRHHSDGFCCGGGGGRMWLEENLGTRINEARTKEAMASGAEIFAVACPLCLTMFEDGLKSLSAEEKYRVMDVVEILAEKVETPQASPAKEPENA